MTIGERIKIAREQAGITQVELGEKIGVSGVAIMRYEKNTRQPRIEQLQRIAAALNVDVNWLMNGQTLEQRNQAWRDLVANLYENEFEEIKAILGEAGFLLSNVFVEDGETASDDYLYYVWHEGKDSKFDSVTHTLGEIKRLITIVSEDAEAHKRDYFRKRLDSELFFGCAKSHGTPPEPPAAPPGDTDTPAAEGPQKPPEGV